MTAIRADNIGKAYRRYKRPIDSLKELVLNRTYHEDFWALKNTSFSCDQGQVLGVVGDNGAGKSTLLKLLAGTLRPTEGELKLKGRVSAILELGSGFHPEYSGIDNVRLGCAMLGLEKHEIEARIEDIVDFSELGDFVYQPVKTYSSGMFVRLAFSVVTSVDPDILIVDEALSVGDQRFQKKSMDRMMSFQQQGKTLVYCSHNLYHVKELCQTALWLENGSVKMQGSVNEVIDAYQDYVRQQNQKTAQVAKKNKTSSEPATDKSGLPAYLISAELLHAESDEDDQAFFRTHSCFAVKVLAHIDENTILDDVHAGIIIKRNDGVQCYGISTVLDNTKLFHIKEQQYGVVYSIADLPLLSGEYVLEIWLVDSSSVHVYDSMYACCPFKIRQDTTEVGVAFIEHQWQVPGQLEQK